MNEEFNQKLIHHGTDVGVPNAELPEPFSSGVSVATSNKLGSYTRRRQEEVISNKSGNFYATSYQTTQKVANRPPSGIPGRNVFNTASAVVSPNQKGLASLLELQPVQEGIKGLTPRNPRRKLISAKISARAAAGIPRPAQSQY